MTLWAVIRPSGAAASDDRLAWSAPRRYPRLAVRILRRGRRGEDVLLWQHFLMQLRSDRAAMFMPPVIRVDGIFGRETRRATVAFQQRYMLRVDGIVGRQTFAKAKELGFGKSTEGLAPLFGPLAQRMREEVPPLLERPSPEPSAAGTGNTREQSHARLRAEPWQVSGVVQSALNGNGAVFQLLKDGAGDYVYDDYSIVVDAMPSNKTPEQFLLDMATDLNGTVGDSAFDTINVFKRKGSAAPKVGDIVAIDIKGPDNGSVILVELSRTTSSFRRSTATSMGLTPKTAVANLDSRGFPPEGSASTRAVSAAPEIGFSVSPGVCHNSADGRAS